MSCKRLRTPYISTSWVSRLPDPASHVSCEVEASWNVMAHAQKPDFVFRRNGRVHLNRRGRQFSRLLAAEVCASTVVMLDTPFSDVAWRVLTTHSIRQFPLHFPSSASLYAITFQLKLPLAPGDGDSWRVTTNTVINHCGNCVYFGHEDACGCGDKSITLRVINPRH